MGYADLELGLSQTPTKIRGSELQLARHHPDHGAPGSCGASNDEIGHSYRHEKVGDLASRALGGTDVRCGNLYMRGAITEVRYGSRAASHPGSSEV